MNLQALGNPWVKKIRLLSALLLVSISFNVALLTSLIYLSIDKGSSIEKIGSQPTKKISFTNSEVLSRYLNMSFNELVVELKDESLLQDGYTKRDLALACIVNYYFFDIDQSLSGTSLQKRRLTFVHKDGREIFDLDLFPGLSDIDYKRILSFISLHQYPFTSEGLFNELKNGKNKEDALIESFLTTSEFYFIFTMFNRWGEKFSKEKILDMLLDGSWSLIKQFISNKNVKFEIDSIRELLTEYIKIGSKNGAYIWILLESDYVLHKTEDVILNDLICAISENSELITLFLKKVLISIRSDQIRKSAAIKLYSLEGGESTLPNPYDHAIVIKHFLPSILKQNDIASDCNVINYIVQNGDSLWKIAKKYEVSIESIRKLNSLKDDKLKVGQRLVIKKFAD